MKELIIDNFAGGGGASTGISLAIGRWVDVAINHDPIAIAMHRVNHPETKHYIENVWDIDPREVVAQFNNRPVGLVWLSPDCTFFSRAKGGKPLDKNIRSLAWVAVRWAATVKPRVIIIENVKEFEDWGALLENNRPCPKRKGKTFNAFVNALKRQGYQVDWRELRACNYGTPTIRERLFLVARCDGLPIVWPEPTHGNPKSAEVKGGKLKPWRTASEIIDWNLPCPSIFESAEEIKEKYGLRAVRPLVEKSIRRIARGIQKFVVDNPQPFIARQFGTSVGHNINSPLGTITAGGGGGKCQLILPFLSQYHSYKNDGVRGQVIDSPLMTIDTNPRYALTMPFISKYYGVGVGSDVLEPLHTVTTKDRNAVVVNYLSKINSKQDFGYWPQVREMLNKYCNYNIADDEILFFEIGGEKWFISDIGMRMFQPRELFAAQGFPANYIIDRDENGKRFTKTEQVAKCGNAVPPPFAEALVRSNLPELCGEQGGAMRSIG